MRIRRLGGYAKAMLFERGGGFVNDGIGGAPDERALQPEAVRRSLLAFDCVPKGHPPTCSNGFFATQSEVFCGGQEGRLPQLRCVLLESAKSP